MISEVKKRKKTQKNEKQDSSQASSNKKQKNRKPPKYGFLPRISPVRLFSKLVIVTAILVVGYFYGKFRNTQISLAKVDQQYDLRSQSVNCDRNYLEELERYPDCIPKRCGRLVSDSIISSQEADILLRLAKRGTSLSDPAGGVSIMDLHSGTLTYKNHFINFYKAFEKEGFLTKTDVETYQLVKDKIQNAIATQFNIKSESLHLTYPTFFSKLTNKTAVSPNDEYWKVHVDKYTYKSFHYTTLLYLNDYERDFTGGRFIFTNDKRNITVEPRTARVSMFTSGSENPHHVERVETGERYAITIAFTCDETAKITNRLLEV